MGYHSYSGWITLQIFITVVLHELLPLYQKLYAITIQDTGHCIHSCQGIQITPVLLALQWIWFLRSNGRWVAPNTHCTENYERLPAMCKTTMTALDLHRFSQVRVTVSISKEMLLSANFAGTCLAFLIPYPSWSWTFACFFLRLWSVQNGHLKFSGVSHHEGLSIYMQLAR